MNWFIFAILAAIINTLYVIIYTYIIRDRLEGYSNFDLIINFCIIVGMVGLLLFIIKKDRKLLILDKKIITPKFISLVVLGIILLLLYCILLIKSNKLVNNPSYTLSIINMNCILFILISIFVFKQNINKFSILGIFLLVIGMSLILVFNKSEKNMEMKLLDKIFK
tara:strand:- start:457 stop:954 length:498 start_codon:yes stop_codon:yes gene_type:complete